MIVTRGLGRGAPGEIVAFGLCTGAIIPPPAPPSGGGWPYDRRHHRTFEWRRWYPQQQEVKRKRPPAKRLVRVESVTEDPPEVIEVVEATAYVAGLSTHSAVGMVFLRANGVVRASGIGTQGDVGYVAAQGVCDVEVVGLTAYADYGAVGTHGDCRVVAPSFLELTATGRVSISTIHNPSDEELILMILQMDDDSA